MIDNKRVAKRIKDSYPFWADVSDEELIETMENSFSFQFVALSIAIEDLIVAFIHSVQEDIKSIKKFFGVEDV